MRIDLKGILEGAWNSIFVKDSIEKVHEDRLHICNGCSWNSTAMKDKGYKTFRPDFFCTQCGCNLDMKTRCMSCDCPIGKWTAQMTEEEENKLTDKLKENGKGEQSNS